MILTPDSSGKPCPVPGCGALSKMTYRECLEAQMELEYTASSNTEVMVFTYL